MSVRKPKKFCRLTKFLEITDKDLYQTFDDLCLFSLFRTRGTRGVTFLYPTDKKYKKKIIDLAYSNEPEKAVDMIKTLVLMDYLPNPSDFKTKQDDIPNSLKKKLEVEDADSKSVKLKGGMKLELDTTYIPLHSNDNVAVYKLSGSGELPITGTTSTLKYAQCKTGGNYYGGIVISDYKLKMSKLVETLYINDDGQNIYKVVVGIVCQLANDENRECIYDNLCASDRASYYNILCPHSADNPCKLSEHVYEQIAKLTTTNWYQFKNNKSFPNATENLIKTVRSERNIEYEKNQRSNLTNQQKILNNDGSPMEYIASVKTAYSTDRRKLYKDLLTIYCYLSTIKEAEEPNDTTYYEKCFLPVMKKIFNDQEQLLVKGNDLAHNLTLYGNLIKSDAFKYIPTISTDPRIEEYEDLDGVLPEPTLKQKMFTISKNNLLIKHGGCDDDIESINTLMGGADIRHTTQMKAGMSESV
jgi:hypothetical protein